MGNWADDLRSTEFIIRNMYRDWDPDDFSDRPDHPDNTEEEA
jgi:hypothetical protein